MAKKQRKYDMEYKIQAVKLAKELGGAKAAAELGIPENTMYAWTKAAREGRRDQWEAFFLLPHVKSNPAGVL